MNWTLQSQWLRCFSNETNTHDGADVLSCFKHIHRPVLARFNQWVFADSSGCGSLKKASAVKPLKAFALLFSAFSFTALAQTSRIVLTYPKGDANDLDIRITNRDWTNGQSKNWIATNTLATIESNHEPVVFKDKGQWCIRFTNAAPVIPAQTNALPKIVLESFCFDSMERAAYISAELSWEAGVGGVPKSDWLARVTNIFQKIRNQP